MKFPQWSHHTFFSDASSSPLAFAKERTEEEKSCRRGSGQLESKLTVSVLPLFEATPPRCHYHPWKVAKEFVNFRSPTFFCSFCKIYWEKKRSQIFEGLLQHFGQFWNKWPKWRTSRIGHHAMVPIRKIGLFSGLKGRKGVVVLQRSNKYHHSLW